MIKSFSVEGLNESRDVQLSFNKDLNIITGKNGSGKTNLLKLIWYMASSNLERTIPEIPFKRAEIVTDSFSLSPSQEADDGDVEPRELLPNPVDGEIRRRVAFHRR